MSDSAHVLPKHMGGGPHGLGKYFEHSYRLMGDNISFFLFLFSQAIRTTSPCGELKSKC